MSASDDDLSQIDPLLADYVDAFRQDETPPEGAAAETWAGIEARTRRPFPVWIPVAVVAAAGVIVVALLDPGSLRQRGDVETPEQVPYRSELRATAGDAVDKTMPAPKPESERGAAPSDSEHDSDSEPVHRSGPADAGTSGPEPKPKPKSVRTAPKPAAEKRPSALARETALIGEIRRAQAAGRYAEVVLLTSQHAKRFPRGSFADERSLARARALCRLGKKDQARKVSVRFVRKHPRSHLVPQFEAICVD